MRKTCMSFGEEADGKVKVKGTFAKMARGQMCAWMAAHQIESVKEVKEFHESGYRYAPQYSSETEFVFLRS